MDQRANQLSHFYTSMLTLFQTDTATKHGFSITQLTPYFNAMGYGGQFIIVVPPKKLVVTASCEWQSISSNTADNNWFTIMNTIANSIIPAFR